MDHQHLVVVERDQNVFAAINPNAIAISGPGIKLEILMETLQITKVISASPTANKLAAPIWLTRNVNCATIP